MTIKSNEITVRDEFAMEIITRLCGIERRLFEVEKILGMTKSLQEYLDELKKPEVQEKLAFQKILDCRS